MKPAGLLLMLLLSGLALALSSLNAQQLPADDLAHMREELGVNNFTAPSIEKVFRQLTALQPLTFEKLWRQPPGDTPQSRTQIALLTGAVIADGFLAVSAEKQSRIEPVARALLRLSKGLGIGDRVTKHGQGILELAARERWPEVRRELMHAQADVEAALLDLKDEEIAHLIALGGWIRGLEITSAAVADRYTPERAQVLAQPELLDYFTARMSTLNPNLQRTKLVKTLRQNTAKVQEILSRAKEKPLSEEEVKQVNGLAREMTKALAAQEENGQ
ncbi:MAG: hypothetical protein EOP84_19710 [Verrucomicrobiaceae bacterium]|nr:MAG: hypothetical protein EOP84_19710 [Verrucomicrobiaceae bacterium]